MTSKQAFSSPLLIEDEDLSLAWGRVVRHVVSHKGKEVSPLVVSITGFGEDGTVVETPEIRVALDDLLAEQGFKDIENVAFTIFPQRYWKMAHGDRKKLFSSYIRAYPRLRKMNIKSNKDGLYFERLVAYDAEAPNNGNQLETILQRYQRTHSVQRMQLQASTYDPRRDQTGTAIQGFPCLQHVTFVPTSGELVLNAFYATQQLFVRAYGNYLGLAQLGAFMAHEMGLKLARVNVHIGIEKLEKVSKNCDGIAKIIGIVNERREGDS